MRYLVPVYASVHPLIKLEDEARNFIIKISEPQRDTNDKSCSLLGSLFGTADSMDTSVTRYQLEKEGLMQYFDALEDLRKSRFPDEPITTRHYGISQPFKVDDVVQVLKRELLVL